MVKVIYTLYTVLLCLTLYADKDVVYAYENEFDKEVIDVLVKISLPKKVLNFIIHYCELSNIDVNAFILSMFMNSVSELLENIEDDSVKKVFKDIGVW